MAELEALLKVKPSITEDCVSPSRKYINGQASYKLSIIVDSGPASLMRTIALPKYLTCSIYKPGATNTVSPSTELLTAAWIDAASSGTRIVAADTRDMHSKKMRLTENIVFLNDHLPADPTIQSNGTKKSHTVSKDSLFDKKIKPKYDPPRPGDVKHSLADVTLAQKTIGFKPKVQFKQGLQKAIDWYRDNLL